MSSVPQSGVAAIILDGTAIDRAIIAAGHKVIEHHRMLGVPLVVWRDGKVAEICADTISVEPGQDRRDMAKQVAERPRGTPRR